MRKPFVIVALVALVACGGTSGPVEIPQEELPFPVARAPGPVETPGPARTFTVYFTRGDRLIGARRAVKVADAPSAEAALRALLQGPSPREVEQGVETQLPAAVRLLDLRIGPTSTHVDLSAEFQEPSPPELIALRVAQVVWTLTEFPGITAVRFSIDGEEIAVITAAGTAADRPVERADYSAISPR
jgi:spore germination protein GerM